MGNPIHYDKLKFYLGCEQKKEIVTSRRLKCLL